ncbi:MAG: TraR/DksA family transcriptional regulator [Acidobacteria bacterium]|nr:TraR/DksA family transcriptional regulator [Acidobacteriota bacterium]
MNKKTLDRYRKMLIAKQENLVDSYMKNKNYGKEADTDQGTQDIADRASNAYTKEFLYSLSNSERQILHQVQEALERIKAKTFGVCMECEETVQKKRLDAVPWAQYCISCQEKVEKGQRV